MNFTELINQKSYSDLFKIGLRLCRPCLLIWENYATENSLEYQEGITGFTMKVKKELLSETFITLELIISSDFKEKVVFENLYEEFKEHNTSLENWDFELPEAVKMTFLSYFNLLFTTKQYFFSKTECKELIVALEQLLWLNHSLRLLSEQEILEIMA